MTPTIPPNLARQLKKELARRSLYEFVKQAWHVVEPATEFVDSGHLQIICDELQYSLDNPTNLVISIPPRCSKSLIAAVFYPAWTWTHSPHIQFLTASYANSLATRDAVKSRRILDSPWYQLNWGDSFQLTGDQNQKTRYENDKGGHRIICSPDSSTTGEGGHVLIVDDALNARDGNSVTARESVISWWNESFYNRLNNPSSGSRIVIGQRLHEDDLPGYVLSSCDCRHICLPAEFDPGITTHTFTGYEQEGDLLSPERLPLQYLNECKSKGSRYYAAQYGQRPVPQGGNLIKQDWLELYTELPQQFDTIIQSWDLASSEKTSADFTVGMVLGRSGANIYLIDLVRGRWEFPEQVRQIQNLSQKHPRAQIKLLENTSNGRALVQSLRNQIQGIIPTTPSKDKITRLNEVIGMIESHNLYLPANAPWTQELIHEITTFPASSHDDQLDTLTQGLARFQTSRINNIASQKY